MIQGSVRIVLAVLAGALVLAVASLVPGTIFGESGNRGLGGLGGTASDGGAQALPFETSPGDEEQDPVLDLSDEDIPADALAAYQRAADIMATVKPHCGLSWTVLAAIGRVESDHGRSNTGVLSDRSAGPMKIRPTTWNEVGVDGDGDGVRSVEDLDDAALAVAVYLCTSSEDLRIQSELESALSRWNESEEFLTAVLAFDELYRDGDFEVAGKDKGTVLAAGLLYGPSLSATPLDTDALLGAGSPRLLPPRVLAAVTAEAAEAVESAGAGGPISTETEAVKLPTAEVTPSETRSFVAGAPVGEPPSDTTPTEQPTELPAELPEELAPEPPAPQPSGSPDVPGALDPTPSEPAPTTPGPTAPSAPAPSDPTPSDPTPSDPTPSDPTPSDPTPSDPTPSDPAPSDPTPSDPTPSDPTPSDPAPSDPAPSDPAPSDPATSEPPPPEPSAPAASEPPPPEPAPSDTTSSEPAPSEPAPSEPAPSEPAASEPAPTDSTASGTATDGPSAG